MTVERTHADVIRQALLIGRTGRTALVALEAMEAEVAALTERTRQAERQRERADKRTERAKRNTLNAEAQLAAAEERTRQAEQERDDLVAVEALHNTQAARLIDERNAAEAQLAAALEALTDIGEGRRDEKRPYHTQSPSDWVLERARAALAAAAPDTGDTA